MPKTDTTKPEKITMLDRKSHALFVLENGLEIIIRNDSGYSAVIDARLCSFESMHLGDGNGKN